MNLDQQKKKSGMIVMNAGKNLISKGVLNRLMAFPSLRKRLSSALARKKPVRIDISGPKGRYVHFRIESPKKFHPQSIRVKSVGTRGTKITTGCPLPRKNWNAKTKRCKVGTRGQSVLIPKKRVSEIVRQFAKVPKKKIKRIAANPKKKKTRKGKIKKNPALMTLTLNPFKKNKNVPFEKFYKWAKKNLDHRDINRLNRAIKKYKEFHQGSLPKTVSHEVLNIGSGSQRDFVFSMGKSPDETYIPPSHSRKQDGDVTYLHEYENFPESLVNADGSVIMKPLKGKTKITDWIHG